jgi:hypothetical protein
VDAAAVDEFIKQHEGMASDYGTKAGIFQAIDEVRKP